MAQASQVQKKKTPSTSIHSAVTEIEKLSYNGLGHSRWGNQMRTSVLVFSLILIVPNAIAAPSVKRATPAEAKEMLRKATAYYDQYGRKKALVEFNKGRSPFRDRDLYVFCVGPDNRFVANGQFPEFVGHLADTIKDVDGKSVVEAGRKIATTSGNGELHYIWPNPETGLLESKISYFARAGHDVCGVGAYNPK